MSRAGQYQVDKHMHVRSRSLQILEKLLRIKRNDIYGIMGEEEGNAVGNRTSTAKRIQEEQRIRPLLLILARARSLSNLISLLTNILTMDIVEIRCPRCGSTVTKSQKPNEYTCAHCHASFRFVDSSKQTVTTDVIIRNCAYCGKPLETGKGFRCTSCGSEYFCESCVDKVQGKYVCFSCIAKSGQKCNHCNKHAVYKCINCGRMACKQHPFQSRFVTSQSDDALVFYCGKCGGLVCNDCAYLPLFGSVKCPKCHSSLEVYGQYK